MESALILSGTEKSIDFLTEMLTAVSCNQIVTLQSCQEARRMLMEREFDLVIINVPLRDETGEAMAKQIASKGLCQVILIVKNEYYDDMTSVTEDYGVLTVSKPINRVIFRSTLMLAKSANARIKRVQAENRKLNQKIEDIKIVDRAKCILISNLSMSEQDAHKYIEKQAMDMRVTKRIVAEGILKTYEY